MRIPNPSSDLPKRMCDGVEGRGGGNGKSIMHIIIYYLVLCTYGIVDSWLRRRAPVLAMHSMHASVLVLRVVLVAVNVL